MPTRKATDYIVVHCSATRPSQNIGRDEIDAWHRQRGFDGIGYHFVVRRDGTVETGRKQLDVGAHVKGFNSRALGVCLVGGLDDHGQPAALYTERQWDSLHGLLLGLHTTYPDAVIQGHRDFPNVAKACPSFDVTAWLATRDGLTSATSSGRE